MTTQHKLKTSAILKTNQHVYYREIAKAYVVYKAMIMTQNSTKYYPGAMEGTFKQKTSAHNLLFSNPEYSNNTTQPTFI